MASDESKYLTYKTYHTPGLIQDTLQLPFGTPDKRTCLIIANQRPQPESSHFIVKEYHLDRKVPCYLHPLQTNPLGALSLAAKKADVCFEIEKLPHNNLRFMGRENDQILLGLTTLPSDLTLIRQGTFQLRRQDNLTVWSYGGQDGSYLAFAVQDNGDIEFRPIDTHTGYHSYKAWAFKTPGKILNFAEACFYYLYLQALQVHNFGLLKCFGMDSQQSYFFNKGIVHLGDETGIASLDIYSEYLPLIDEAAEPHYQEDVIDDYGVTMAEKGLKVEQMTHRIHRFVETEQLELDQAPLEVLQQLNVTGPIIGTTPRIINHGHMNASAITSCLNLQDWTNKGIVRLSQPSEIFARNELDNSGMIRSKSSLTLSSKKKPKSLGTVITDGDIKAMIEDILSLEEQEIVFGKARFFSKNRKLVIDMVHHTDHYLNTITNHYVQENGWQRFTHKTETGYVFQRRTSERSQKVIDNAGLEVPEEIESLDKAFNDRHYLLSKLREGIKDRLRALTRFYDIVGGLQDLNKMLASVLSGMGIEDEEVKDIVTDPGLQSLLMALGMPEKDALKLIESDDFQLKPLYSAIWAHSQRLGLSALEWVKNHSLEFLRCRPCLT